MTANENKPGQGSALTPVSPLDRTVEEKMREAKRAIIAETLWPRLWLPVMVAGVFVLLCAFEVWRMLPPRFHLSLLWWFGAVFVLSFLPLIFWKRPTRHDAVSRIEKASALKHHPLTAYNDTLSQTTVSPETAALWRAHRDQAAKLLAKLKSGAPRPRVDKYDPLALRALIALLLVAATAWGWKELPSRVQAAFNVPDIKGAGPALRVDAWVSPPPYTRKEPFVLASAGANEPVPIPEGSALTVKINGEGARDYRVALSPPAEASEPLKPSEQAAENYAEFSGTIDRSATLSVDGMLETVRSWPLTIVPDQPPRIAFSGPIEVSPRAVMLFKYKANDDYGVASAEARIERVDERAGQNAPSAPKIGQPPIFPLALPRAPVKEAEAKTYKDLTAHPWAGLPVVVTLAAKDEAGHTGYSAPRGIILPERAFTKPIAKAVIAQRRALVERPADIAPVASNLNALGISAEDEGMGPPIYLALRSAYWRLRNSPSFEDIESIVGQLWDVALRIEDGNLSAAERELRAAEDRLKEAMDKGASEAEIKKLMAELRQALANYLQSLSQQAEKTGKAVQSPNAQTISGQELKQLLDKIERLAKAGSTDAAQQMLNELRDILESLQTAKGGSGEEDKESMQRLDRMTDILRQQQQLLDDTFKMQQRNESQENREPRGQGQRQQGGESSALKNRQDDIQRELQDLLSGLGSKKGDPVMKKLGEAEEAMGDAGQALKDSDLGEAGDQEGRAVESLRQGARSLAEQMMQPGRQRAGGQAGRDPLGRKQGRGQIEDGESVKIPDEFTVQRARAILDELRKRLGQPARPPGERDYLERLVKPF